MQKISFLIYWKNKILSDLLISLQITENGLFLLRFPEVLQSMLFQLFIFQSCKKINLKEVDFLSIKIRSKIFHRNEVDFSLIITTLYKIRWNDTDFSPIIITLKKVRRKETALFVAQSRFYAYFLIWTSKKLILPSSALPTLYRDFLYITSCDLYRSLGTNNIIYSFN